MKKLLFLAACLASMALTRAPNPIASLEVSPTQIQAGDTVTVQWECLRSQTATLSAFGQSAQVPLSGSQSAPVSQGGTVRVVCANGGATDSATAEITIVSDPTPDPIPDPIPDPDPIPEPDPTPDPTPEPDPDPTPVPSGNWPGVPQPEFGLTETSDDVRTSCGTYNGTADRPVMVRVTTTQNCVIQGSYVIVDGSNLRTVGLSGHHLVLRNSEISGANTGTMVYFTGSDIVIFGNEIHDNRNPSNPSQDRHGVGAGGGAQRFWILDNHIYGNSGDSIQFCHECIGRGNGPMDFYISGNRMHDDRENAIDLKEFRGVGVITANIMSGYQASSTSNGDALRVNDEGNQGELWIAHNSYSNNRLEVNTQGARATVYVLDDGQVASPVGSRVTIANGAQAEQYYDLYLSRYGVSLRP